MQVLPIHRVLAQTRSVVRREYGRTSGGEKPGIGMPTRSVSRLMFTLKFPANTFVLLRKLAQFPWLWDGAVAACAMSSGPTKLLDSSLYWSLAYDSVFSSAQGRGWPEEWGTPQEVCLLCRSILCFEFHKHAHMILVR